MTDVYFTGPDAYRLMSDTGTNSFATFGPDKAKHFIACNASGYLIGTAVLFGHNAEEVSLVGPAAAANWVQFHAETGNYDVEVRRDERTVDNGGQRELFRCEIEGPAAWSIVEKANGGPIEKVGFFRTTSFQLNGIPVKGLVHTMAGLPGAESMGLEIWGPVEHGPRCLDALLSAGAEFDMVRGGGLAYYAGGIESGYMAQPTAAVYSGADLQVTRAS
jgi:glycine cleavage system aminomethyltransferase T